MGGQRTKTNHKSSPCHYVTGELKKMGGGGGGGGGMKILWIFFGFITKLD